MSTRESIVRQFWRYALPTVAAMLVNGLYQVVDGIFIGHYIGADGLAGINIAWPIISAMVGIGLMIGVGTGALASIRQGEGQLNLARETMATGFALILLFSPLLSLLLYFFSPALVAWQGADGNECGLAMQYLDVLALTLPVTLGSIAIPFLVRNDNSPNLATMLMVAGALLNIVLDYIFIVVLDWELQGAALATALAQLCISLAGIGYFFSARATLRLELNCFRVQWASVPRILSIGSSSLFMYVYGAVMVAMHNWMFSLYGGSVVVGAYAIVSYIVTVYYLVAEGFANGMQPLVSYNYGSRRLDNVFKLLQVTLVTTLVGGILFVAGLNIFPEQIVAVFNNTDPELKLNTLLGIRLHLFVVFLDGFLVVVAAFYQGVGLGRKAAVVSIANILFQVPFLLLLPKLWGTEGVWLAYPASNIAMTLLAVVIMRKDLKALRGEAAMRPAEAL